MDGNHLSVTEVLKEFVYNYNLIEETFLLYATHSGKSNVTYILINQLSLVQETVKYVQQSASEVFVCQDFLITMLGKNVSYCLIIHMQLQNIYI